MVINAQHQNDVSTKQTGKLYMNREILRNNSVFVFAMNQQVWPVLDVV